jgi:hypothetical protein
VPVVGGVLRGVISGVKGCVENESSSGGFQVSIYITILQGTPPGGVWGRFRGLLDALAQRLRPCQGRFHGFLPGVSVKGPPVEGKGRKRRSPRGAPGLGGELQPHCDAGLRRRGLLGPICGDLDSFAYANDS